MFLFNLYIFFLLVIHLALGDADAPVTECNSSMGHMFFRNFTDSVPAGASFRRVFGGVAAELEEFPNVCALLDSLWSVRCSATVVAPQWALTAAHCITPRVTYVKYNTRRPASSKGNVATVEYMYQHPQYRVKQMDRGSGMDVVLLHNDVGLVRTKQRMDVSAQPTMLHLLRNFNPFDLYNEEVKVYGFGLTERSALGEELFSVDLQLVRCQWEEWMHCVCGMSKGNNIGGVCSGDSGGPMVYRGVLVGVTSMGPLECALPESRPSMRLTSVFTSTYQYSDVIHDTVMDTDSNMRMNKISAASALPVSCKLLFAMFLLLPAQ